MLKKIDWIKLTATRWSDKIVNGWCCASYGYFPSDRVDSKSVVLFHLYLSCIWGVKAVPGEVTADGGPVMGPKVAVDDVIKIKIFHMGYELWLATIQLHMLRWKFWRTYHSSDLSVGSGSEIITLDIGSFLLVEYVIVWEDNVVLIPVKEDRGHQCQGGNMKSGLMYQVRSKVFLLLMMCSVWLVPRTSSGCVTWLSLC